MAPKSFPLGSVNDVRLLFEAELDADPDLVLLSVVAGMVENTMTRISPPPADTGGSNTEEASLNSDNVDNASLRLDSGIEWSLVEALCKKFDATVRGFCDTNMLARVVGKTAAEADPADMRRMIKHVSDIIWNTLSKSQYKDRPHLQSIYSYLTGNKLDCFGVAFAVVAACQMLAIPGVHLALSEDHAWVVFGKEGAETAEVTWHGKGNEDKRGQPIDRAKAKTSWLYSAGNPVVCDRHMEVAALVSSMNPAINSNMDSLEVGALQQELLWLLYDMGHLRKYPMALGNLGDLEEISPSKGRKTCAELYEEALAVNRNIYENHHVYPYTYEGGYFYRVKNYPRALKAWADAADVIKRYSYSKDDEEIYKEFMEIANELIPHVMRSDCSDAIRQSPASFSHVLRFYDGICCWEEGSPTPILHIGWARPMVATCSKFDASARKITTDGPAQGDMSEELKLASAKMAGLKGLLCAEKLNASAIQLQLTALSQTAPAVSKKLTVEGEAVRPKRSRRE